MGWLEELRAAAEGGLLCPKSASMVLSLSLSHSSPAVAAVAVAAVEAVEENDEGEHGAKRQKVEAETEI